MPVDTAEKGAGGAADASREPQKAALGVLFVHGIGAQTEGVTLSECGEPFLRWLGDWLDCKEPPQVLSAVLKPSEAIDQERAWAEIDLRVKDCPPSRLIIAESLWASQFDPPPYGRLCSWLLSHGSWIALRQMTVHPPRWMRYGGVVIFWRFFAALCALLLVVVPLQLIFCVLYLVWLLPIDALKAWVQQITRVLSGVLGDCYVFTSQPLARQAILSRLMEDLSWLEARCEKVALIAHSQGAAVAFEALRQRSQSQPLRLITYGAGIRKLFEIRLNLEKDGAWPNVMRFAWLGVLAALAACAIIWQDLVHLLKLAPDEMARSYNPSSHFSILFLFGAYLVGFVLAQLMSDIDPQVDEALEPKMRELLAKGVLWTDLHASRDPVSGGSLLKKGGWKEESQFEESEVLNEGSLIADHTAYWRSGDDFVTRVALVLNATAPQPWLKATAQEIQPALDYLRRCRWMRISLRQTLHFILLGLVLAVLVTRAQVWWPTVEQVVQWPICRRPLALIEWLPINAASLRLLKIALLGIALHLVAFALFLRFISRPLWEWWNELFVRHRLAQLQSWSGGAMRLLVWLLAVGAALAGLIFTLRAGDYGMLYRLPRDIVTGTVRAADRSWFVLCAVVVAPFAIFFPLTRLHRWLARGMDLRPRV